jgi:hypothetical protein
MTPNDALDVSGHLQIYKIYKDGTEEKVFDDHNLITSGMGLGLSMLFAGQGSSIEDFQIRYFQVGTGAATTNNPDYKTFKLATPIPNTDAGRRQYGYVPNSSHPRMNPNGGGASNELFILIPDNAIKKSSPTSVTYVLYLTEQAVMTTDINEIGLFMNNPLSTLLGDQNKRSPLVAYREFISLEKTEQYSLVFKWKLSF